MYELYYSTGGLGGPYPNTFEAKLQALRLLEGNKSERWISIVSRIGSSSYGLMRITRKHLMQFRAMGTEP